jgi:hypothetical protein
MPAKLNMFISNGNASQAQLRAHAAAISTPITHTPSKLNAGMIHRIHNVRPGCGGCGRH